MRIGETTISDPPDDDGEFLAWRDDELSAAGDALLLDERTAGMCFDGRPLTNMEMEAGSIASRRSWRVLAEKWIKSFQTFLEEKSHADGDSSKRESDPIHRPNVGGE